MSKEKKIITILIIIIIGLTSYIVFSARKSSIPSPEGGEELSLEEEILPEISSEGKILGIKYKIVREGTIEHSFAKIKTYDVITDALNRREVGIVSEKLIGEVIKKDNDIDKISLIFFSNEEMIETQPFDIAQVIWWPEGEITREIADNNLRNNYKIDILMR